MTRVRRERALSGGHIRLMVDGGWDAAARAALEGPPFDVLELHQGRYADFEMLVPFVDRISVAPPRFARPATHETGVK